MNIGDRLKMLRLSKGISQEAVAEFIGVKKQTVYKYESSIITNIPLDKVELLAAFFHVSPVYLTGWNDKADGVDTAPPVSADDQSLLDAYHRAPQETKDIVDVALRPYRQPQLEEKAI